VFVIVKKKKVKLASVVTSTSKMFIWNAMAEANAVSIKLQTFWTAQPHVWFQQAEAQFIIHCITSHETKYTYTVAALDQDTANHLLNPLSRPPFGTAIKTRLLKTFGLSRRVLAIKLLEMDDLGDHMPSALDVMLSLLDGH